jgi:signal transduction histidine kinase
MVNRSLILKAYLYAVGVLLVTFVFSYGMSRLLVAYGVMESYRSVGGDVAEFMAREVAASVRDGSPDLARIDELSRSMHLGLSFVPAGASASYPAEVAHRPWVHEGPSNHQPFSYWVKVAPEGHIIGALRVQFQPPPAQGAFRWFFAGFLMVVLGFIIVPPLYLWVLRPLRRMVDTAHRLGGDLGTPVALTRRDEFGELEGAFESLRQQIQRMLAQKERLLTDISHELRAPLSRMAIAVPLMREEGDDSPYLAHIERNMLTMDHLIGELLTLSRGQTPPERDREPLDLAVMAEELLAERGMVLAQHGLTLEEGLNVAPVYGDRRLLERAMGNLIDNAVKYGAGRLRVETGRDAGCAFFRVTDHGPGIPEHELPLLFEPFYRPDASRSRHTGGTGLGLAIVKAVAQSHGGEASLSSVFGHGATATLRLPLRS